jgi:hypothetical protein
MQKIPSCFISERAQPSIPAVVCSRGAWKGANTMSIMTIHRSHPSLTSILRWSVIGAAGTLAVTITLLLIVSLILMFQVNAIV